MFSFSVFKHNRMTQPYEYKKNVMLATLLVAALVLAACPAPVAEAPAAMEEEASASEAMDEGPCAPAMDGPLAGIDPRGQTIVWWHQHSGSREEKLAVIVEDFNTNNECGIVLDASRIRAATTISATR